MPDQSAPAAELSPAAGQDSYFILRDCRELLQRRLEELIRQATNHSPRAMEAFSREFSEGFDELARASQRDGFEQTNGLTASRISLVGNDDLELEIRIGELAARIKDNPAIDLWQTQLRFMTLLQRRQMNADDNPAGLEPINCGLWALCKEAGGTLDQKFDQIARIEDFLQARLPAVYGEINALLERHRVEPAAIQPIQPSASGQRRHDEKSAPAGAGAASDNASNVLAALQQAMQQKVTGGGGSGGGAGGSGGGGGGGGGNAGGAGDSGNHAVLDAATVVMIKHLVKRLSALEAQNLAATSADDDAPLKAYTAEDFDLPLGQPAAIALDTLSLIFAAIFAAADLPQPVKAAIAGLQIPLLKLALLDATLFANALHPARRLINLMARAALGLAPETGREHPVCAALLALANRVHAMLESSDGELSPYLAELDALIARRDQQQRDGATPYIGLVQSFESADSARRDADDWLARLAGRTHEPSIRAFLADTWREIMRRASVEGGTRGLAWQAAAKTADDLLWSLSPKQDSDERKKLLTLIPQLLRQINAGFDQLATPESVRKPFLDACFDLQTAALRGRQDLPLPRAGAANATKLSDEAPVSILEDAGKLVQYVGRPGVARTPARSATRTWRVGEWLRFRLPDGEVLCGALCWQSEAGSSVLLFNVDWGFAVAGAPAFLDQQVASGEAIIETDSALFDRAATQALQSIRPAQGST